MEVKEGDILTAKAFARYENKVGGYPRNGITLSVLSSLLGNSFNTMAGFEGKPLAEVNQLVNTALGAGAFLDDDDEGIPFAYINYIIFDAGMVRIDSKRQRISVDAGFDPPEAALQDQHEEMKFPEDITIGSGGKYIYLWVSNESENTKVWFDDFKVTHASNFVAQATDFGAWGDVLREQRSAFVDRYRFGYQGQYSERDEETSWNHFEAREYDLIIGRWLIPDPAKQHFSPYLAFSNNPINRIDPDGKWDFGEKVKNWFRYGEFLTNAQFDTKYSERINVFIWDKTSDKDVGHTALEIDGVVYGYYPTDVNGNGAYDKGDLNNSPGDLHIDARVDFNSIYAGDKVNSYSIKVTPAQKAAVLTNLGDVRLDPGTYSLVGRQCTSTAMSVMGKAGIRIADAGGSIDRNHIGVAPRAFEAMLNNYLNSFLVAGKTSFTVRP